METDMEKMMTIATEMTPEAGQSTGGGDLGLARFSVSLLFGVDVEDFSIV